ncbi:MAG: histone deacetylase [Nitrospirae bacterium]|nr:histone deacetylase [Nitrospirota bacterium]
MKKTAFIYDDIYLKHEMPPYHPESIFRLEAITDNLKKSDMWNLLIHLKPVKADMSEIEAVHTKSYIEKTKKIKVGYLDPDTYMCEDTLEVSLYAAGAMITAIDNCKSGVIERAFCAVRPPGHHAEKDRGMGFCIYNNVAVGARYAQKLGFRKVFIADFDVHHGNGTQHIFYDDDSVYYFSTHQYPHYPGTGADSEKGRGLGKGFTYNIPLDQGSGDKEMLDAYGKVLPRLVKDYCPDIMLVSAGYDIHEKDPLAGLKVSDNGITSIVKNIINAAGEIPIIFTLEGGYSLEALATSVLITLRELLG